MSETLDGIMEQYDQAGDQERLELQQQVCQMKQMSDSFIEQWLEFEEKVADFQEGCSSKQKLSEASYGFQSVSTCQMSDLVIPDEAAEIVNKGQGYYKLFMFDEAAELFQEAVTMAPECNLARLFLGMSQMHRKNWHEAQRQFQLLIVLSDFPKWLALGYNALGCIQAVHMNMAHAEKLFRKAYEVYPSFTDSLNNLKSCQETPGQLSLYFGSTELCCL
ncbi:tetratricopeptide repeat protein [Paenibacillus sp. GCM10027627]